MIRHLPPVAMLALIVPLLALATALARPVAPQRPGRAQPVNGRVALLGTAQADVSAAQTALAGHRVRVQHDGLDLFAASYDRWTALDALREAERVAAPLDDALDWYVQGARTAIAQDSSLTPTPTIPPSLMRAYDAGPALPDVPYAQSEAALGQVGGEIEVAIDELTTPQPTETHVPVRWG